jgi:hypothetical protein
MNLQVVGFLMFIGFLCSYVVWGWQGMMLLLILSGMTVMFID